MQTWIDAYDEFAEMVDSGDIAGTCAMDVTDLRQLLKIAKAAQALDADHGGRCERESRIVGSGHCTCGLDALVDALERRG